MHVPWQINLHEDEPGRTTRLLLEVPQRCFAIREAETGQARAPGAHFYDFAGERRPINDHQLRRVAHTFASYTARARTGGKRRCYSDK